MVDFSLRLCFLCFLTTNPTFLSYLFFKYSSRKMFVSVTKKLEVIKEKMDEFDFIKYKKF